MNTFLELAQGSSRRPRRDHRGERGESMDEQSIADQERLERWLSGLSAGMTAREHFVDSIAYVCEMDGGEFGTWSDDSLLEYFVRDNLGLRTMSLDEFKTACPWFADALQEARADGARRIEEGRRFFADPEVRRQVEDIVRREFGPNVSTHFEGGFGDN